MINLFIGVAVGVGVWAALVAFAHRCVARSGDDPEVREAAEVVCSVDLMLCCVVVGAAAGLAI